MPQYTANPRKLPCGLHYDRRAIGARIKALREARGWTGTKLARFCGVNAGTVTRWEQGVRVPDRDSLVAMSIAFRRSIDCILFDVPRRGTLWSLAAK